MNRRGLKWAAAGTAGLVLVVLGIHLAWECHRVRLHTPTGTVWVGMTLAEADAALGPPFTFEADRDNGLARYECGKAHLAAIFRQGRLEHAILGEVGEVAVAIPRPSLVEHVRSWFTGKAE